MKNIFVFEIKISISHNKNEVVRLDFLLGMFDLKELKLMFLDPTDLIINNINRFLCSNKTIKLIFS
tara:strand:- start:215 stop:412 length:198 start_codon:yes stop_codon:yes gene_type:complete